MKSPSKPALPGGSYTGPATEHIRARTHIQAEADARNVFVPGARPTSQCNRVTPGVGIRSLVRGRPIFEAQRLYGRSSGTTSRGGLNPQSG